MVAPYLRLVSHRGVPRLLAALLLARISTPVLSLALLLVAFDQLGSYGLAGLVLGAHALAVALCAPIGGRLADRLHPRRVLLAFLAAHLIAYGLLMLTLATTASAPALIAAAVLLGATTPQSGPISRSCWPRVVPAESLHSAYALDTMLNELLFIVGPVLVAVLLLVMPATAILALTGATIVSGVLLLLTVEAVRDQQPVAPPTHHQGRRLTRLVGPLRHGPILTLLVIAACDTFAFGCLRIATTASATDFGAESAAGLLLGLLSLGTLIGGLIFGARHRPTSGGRLLVLLCLIDGVVLLADGFAPTLLLLGLLITLTGLLTGPREALHQVLLADAAPEHQRTEVFAWLNTFMWGGYGIGTAVAGALTDPNANGALAFGAAAVVVWLGGLLVVACYRPRPGPSAVSFGLPTTP